MGIVTITKDGEFIHSEYTTTAKLNKLPSEVKEIILKEMEKEPLPIVEEITE